jgi:hypothetical protein
VLNPYILGFFLLPLSLFLPSNILSPIVFF